MRKTVPKKAAKTRTIPYDVAEQLRTPEEMAAYLDAWTVLKVAKALGFKLHAEAA